MSVKPKKFKLSDMPKRREPSYTTLYSNNASIVGTFFDLRLTFSEVMPDEQDVPIINERATVVMTWEHAKALSTLLQQKVANYEAANTIRSSSKDDADDDI